MAQSRKTYNRRSPSYQPPPLKTMLEFIWPQALMSLPGGWQWSSWLLAMGAVLMAWDDPPSLTARFQSVLATLGQWFPRRKLGTTYQGFIKALKTHSALLLDCLSDHLRSHLPHWAGAHWRRQGWIAFAVDGSRVECPRTAANERQLRCAGKKRTAPQLFVTTIYHMGTGLPWSFRAGPGTDSERHHLRQMLPLLPEQALLVADAGFVGYELLDSILSGGRHLLIRVGSNIRLLRELGYTSVHQDQTVCLWPDKQQKRRQPPLVLRLIRLHNGRKPMYLLTDLPAGQLTDRQAGQLYRLRWGIEVFYRSFKCTLGHRKMRSRAPQQAHCELSWAVMGLWILSAMSIKELIAHGKDPLELSVASAVQIIRLSLRHAWGGGSLRRLRESLGQAVKDSYVRTAPKTARNWPHKKTDKPPGPPRIQQASHAQVTLAQSLLQHKLVA